MSSTDPNMNTNKPASLPKGCQSFVYRPESENCGLTTRLGRVQTNRKSPFSLWDNPQLACLFSFSFSITSSPPFHHLVHHFICSPTHGSSSFPPRTCISYWQAYPAFRPPILCSSVKGLALSAVWISLSSYRSIARQDFAPMPL